MIITVAVEVQPFKIGLGFPFGRHPRGRVHDKVAVFEIDDPRDFISADVPRSLVQAVEHQQRQLSAPLHPVVGRPVPRKRLRRLDSDVGASEHNDRPGIGTLYIGGQEQARPKLVISDNGEANDSGRPDQAASILFNERLQSPVDSPAAKRSVETIG